MRCPFHSMLSALKVFAGLPVPWSVKWFGDKPDFRQPDERKIVECVEKKLCAVCGKKLGDKAFYVGGDLCKQNGFFNDPGMHEVCARESMRLCPFLNGRRTHYRGVVEDQPHLMNTAKGRPETMYLFRGWTVTQRFVSVGLGLVIAAGKLKVIETF